MARVTSPLFSMDASGTIGKAIVASKWKGRNYFRRWVIPHNPKSTLQEAVRASMRFLSQGWKSIGATPQGTWAAIADSKKISPFNAFVSANQASFANGDGLTQAYPAGLADTPTLIKIDTAVVNGKYCLLTGDTAALSPDWGWAISITSASTNYSWTNTAVISPVEAEVVPTAQVGPLPAGDYHADSATFGLDGLITPGNTPIAFTIA